MQTIYSDEEFYKDRPCANCGELYCEREITVAFTALSDAAEGEPVTIALNDAHVIHVYSCCECGHEQTFRSGYLIAVARGHA